MAASSIDPHDLSNDIGGVVHLLISIEQICSILANLPNSKKYSLVYQHVLPPNVLQSMYSHGCYRKFNASWFDKYPWLRYSPK